ncbi:unnamed protein product, partial [Arabidopsis halleri]
MLPTLSKPHLSTARRGKLSEEESRSPLKMTQSRSGVSSWMALTAHQSTLSP